jgi:hypothetical protein
MDLMDKCAVCNGKIWFWQELVGEDGLFYHLDCYYSKKRNIK